LGIEGLNTQEQLSERCAFVVKREEGAKNQELEKSFFGGFRRLNP